MSNHNEYIKKITDKLQDWDYEIDRFEHRVADLQQEGKEGAHKVIEKFKTKQAEFKQRVHKLEDAAEEVSEDIKSGLDLSLSALELGLLIAVEDIKEFASKDDEES